MFNLDKFFRRLFPQLIIQRPIITDEDEENINEFVTSSIGRSVMKELHCRLLERMETASDEDLTEEVRKSAVAKKAEILDILTDWKNRYEDLTDPNKK